MDVIDTNTGKSINKQNAFKRFWNKTLNIGKKVGRIIVGRTIPQRLFRLYLVVVIIGALLLCCPFSLKDGVNGFTNPTGKYGFVQALFIACSGFSDTGLTPVPIYTYLSTAGQVILAILIEIGGIGVVALFYYFWNFFKKKEDKIDVGQLYIMQAERGGSKLEESFRVIRKALGFILVTQIIFMFIYAICFTFIPAYTQKFNDSSIYGDGQGISFDDKTKPLDLYHNFGKSLWVGCFTTISAMNNAGFDNISSSSMAPYRNDWGSVLQFFIICELVIGGLGHFVWFDFLEKIKCKASHKPYKMTLYTKVCISSYIIVAVLGIACAFATEVTANAVTNPLTREYTIFGNASSNGEFGQNVVWNKCQSVIFATFNCRSLGMEIVKTDYYCEGTKWVFSILMFIGASPSSTAGGIRTTTLSIIFITIWCKLLGRKNVFFFKRRINNDTVVQAFMIFLIAILILALGVVVLTTAMPKNYEYVVSEYLVECCSAFGTVGLSTGITAVVKWWGLLYLVFLMFVGQLGVINTLLSWTKRHPRKNDIEYPYEEIKIG